MAIDVFSYDDRIIYDNAEHHDESKEGDHVDGDVEEGHQADCAEK